MIRIVSSRDLYASGNDERMRRYLQIAKSYWQRAKQSRNLEGKEILQLANHKSGVGQFVCNQKLVHLMYLILIMIVRPIIS